MHALVNVAQFLRRNAHMFPGTAPAIMARALEVSAPAGICGGEIEQIFADPWAAQLFHDTVATSPAYAAIGRRALQTGNAARLETILAVFFQLELPESIVEAMACSDVLAFNDAFKAELASRGVTCSKVIGLAFSENVLDLYD